MRWLFLVCSLLFTYPTLAQVALVKRVDYPIKDTEDDDYQVLPLGKEGALLTHHNHDNYSRQPHTYRFTRLDTNLTKRWEADYSLPREFTPAHLFANDRYLFQLATEANTDKFSLLRLTLDDGTVDTYAAKLPSSVSISDFKVMGNVAYLAGYYNDRPVVMAYSLFDNSIKVFQGLYVNNVELGSVEVDEFRQEVHVITHTLKKECQFTLRSYAPDGRPLRIVNFSGTKHTLIAGQILPVSADESLLVGNYSVDCTPYSQGIFLTRIRHTETGKLTVTTDRGDSIRYVDFSHLRNFFNYLSPKRQKKMQTRLADRKRLGKDYTFRYRLLVHELLPTPDGLQLIAEVYHPQYRGTATAYALGYGARAWRATQSAPADRYRTTTVFSSGSDRNSSDGYRYTHAFICEFDRQGNLRWDNCLPIDELTGDELTQKVQVSAQGNRLVLAYEQDSDIRTSVIERDSLLYDDEPVPIKAGSEREKVQQAANETLMAWYGPYFLATGYQKLGPERGQSTLPHETFYLTKLAYDAFAPRTSVPKSPPADGGKTRPPGR